VTWLPEYDDVMDIHFELAKQFENDEDPISPPGPRDEHLVYSACLRPRTGIGEQDKYDDEYAKLAALFHSLTQNHAFHNGNKRTALVTLLAALYRNGRVLSIEIDDDEIYELTVAVANGTFLNFSERLPPDDAVEKIAYWLRRNSTSRNSAPSDMDVEEFIKRCQSLGCGYKQVNSFHHVSNGDASIKISTSNKRFAGPVAQTYVKRLGLNLAQTGRTFREFQYDDAGERDAIYRYMAVLRRLAKI